MQASKVSIGRTINLGNYESLRVEVTVDNDSEYSTEGLTRRAMEELILAIDVAKKYNLPGTQAR